MNSNDTKEKLPFSITLGSTNFLKIKMKRSPRLGKIGEPLKELRTMGWVVMSPGRENDIVSALFTTISVSGYEKLCNTGS